MQMPVYGEPTSQQPRKAAREIPLIPASHHHQDRCHHAVRCQEDGLCRGQEGVPGQRHEGARRHQGVRRCQALPVSVHERRRNTTNPGGAGAVLRGIRSDACKSNPDAQRYIISAFPCVSHARMQGDGENQILAWAAARKGEFEVTVAKPGYVYGNLSGSALATVFWVTGMAPYIKTEECAAAMLQQVVEGFEKDPLDNADLVRLGRAELARRKQ